MDISSHFNGKLRDELLNREIFTTLTEAKILIEQWRQVTINSVIIGNEIYYIEPQTREIVFVAYLD